MGAAVSTTSLVSVGAPIVSAPAAPIYPSTPAAAGGASLSTVIIIVVVVCAIICLALIVGAVWLWRRHCKRTRLTNAKGTPAPTPHRQTWALKDAYPIGRRPRVLLGGIVEGVATSLNFINPVRRTTAASLCDVQSIKPILRPALQLSASPPTAQATQPRGRTSASLLAARQDFSNHRSAVSASPNRGAGVGAPSRGLSLNSNSHRSSSSHDARAVVRRLPAAAASVAVDPLSRHAEALEYHDNPLRSTRWHARTVVVSNVRWGEGG